MTSPLRRAGERRRHVDLAAEQVWAVTERHLFDRYTGSGLTAEAAGREDEAPNCASPGDNGYVRAECTLVPVGVTDTMGGRRTVSAMRGAPR